MVKKFAVIPFLLLLSCAFIAVPVSATDSSYSITYTELNQGVYHYYVVPTNFTQPSSNDYSVKITNTLDWVSESEGWISAHAILVLNESLNSAVDVCWRYNDSSVFSLTVTYENDTETTMLYQELLVDSNWNSTVWLSVTDFNLTVRTGFSSVVVGSYDLTNEGLTNTLPVSLDFDINHSVNPPYSSGMFVVRVYDSDSFSLTMYSLIPLIAVVVVIGAIGKKRR